MSQNARRIDGSVVPGTKPAPSPGFVAPCHPTLREKAPPGGRWIHEIKFDGYRTQAHLQNGKPTIYTRAGYDCLASAPMGQNVAVEEGRISGSS